MWFIFKFPQLHYFSGSICWTSVFWTLYVSCTTKQTTETCLAGKTSSYSALVSSFTTFGTYIDCFSKSHKNRRLMLNIGKCFYVLLKKTSPLGCSTPVLGYRDIERNNSWNLTPVVRKYLQGTQTVTEARKFLRRFPKYEITARNEYSWISLEFETFESKKCPVCIPACCEKHR